MDAADSQDNLQRRLKHLIDVRSRIDQDRALVNTLYNNALTGYDVRYSQLSMLLVCATNAFVGLTCLHRYVNTSDWWDTISAQMPVRERENNASEFLMFLHIGFVHSLAMTIESAFRAYIRHFKPEDIKLAAGNFKAVYDTLFKEYFTNVPPEARSLLDLFRLQRNTVHNNGVHFHPRGDNVEVVYKGIQYDFIHGELAQVSSWDLTISIADDFRELMMAIAQDPVLKSIPLISDH